MIKNKQLILASLLTFTLLSACNDSKQTEASSDTANRDNASTTPLDNKTSADNKVIKLVPFNSIPTFANNAANNKAKTKTDESRKTMALALKSGCLACHKIDSKVVGPAWKDVAKRYANDSNAKQILITKVSKGGKGNWTKVTGGIAMPPYSPRVSAANIEKLVDFVLSLK